MKTIEVTARFEIRFSHKVSDEEFAALEQGCRIDDLVDESVVYEKLRSDGECEMDWDFNPPKKTKPKAKRKKRP